MKNPITLFREHSLTYLAEKEDNYFRTRNKKRYKCIFSRSKWFIFDGRKFRMKRRYYLDTKTGEYFYWLDRFLKVKKHQHISKYDQNKIYKMVAIKKMTFSQAAYASDDSVSTSTVHRLIKNHWTNFKVNFNINPRKFKTIYINLDDGYRTLKMGDNWFQCQFKVIQIYQYYFKENHQFINELKAVFISKTKVGNYISTVLAIRKIKALLCKYYINLSDYRIIVCGDGARNLKVIANALGAEFCLDKFHLFKKIISTFKTQILKKIDFICKDCMDSVYKKNQFANEIIDLIEAGKIATAIKSLIDLKKNYDIHSRDLNSLIRYIQGNKKAIEIWQDKVYFGTFTETFVKQLVKSYFGNIGKWYSLQNFMHILSANCLVTYLH